jgi:hypothetical protein
MIKHDFRDDTHYMSAQPKCPVCLHDADIYRRRIDNVFEGSCVVCGNVLITLDAVERLRAENKGYLVSRWFLSNYPIPTLVAANHLDALFKAAPTYSVSEKLDITLAQIEKMTDHPGVNSRFNFRTHFPLIFARNPEEAQFYVLQLTDLGYIGSENGINPRVNARGYSRLQDIRATGKQSNLAFVAMWFDRQHLSTYSEIIKPAILAAGYKPVQMLEVEHVNRIDDEIIAQIRGSRFMVSDFTGQRHGVYFEAGYMLGQGRRVFWTCREADLRDVHFDNRSYNFIFTDDPVLARQQLRARIVALEGEGPDVVPLNTLLAATT